MSQDCSMGGEGGGVGYSIPLSFSEKQNYINYIRSEMYSWD